MSDAIVTQVEVFEEYRDYLFAIAYRMLGSVMEAEDMVQESYLRWQQVNSAEVESPKSYLATILIRLCLDQLKSARMKRERYIGPWLPEPLVADPAAGPGRAAELADSLTMAFLVLLERLSPEQRAVYLLREVFDFEYEEIAAMVGKSQAACRQMVSRARKRVAAKRPRQELSREQGEQAVEQFIAAVNRGDLDQLMEVLEADVVWTSDGGGMRGVAQKPIEGAEQVARFALRLAELAPPTAKQRRVLVNGVPGLLVEVEGAPYAVLAIQLQRGKIAAIHAVVNPAKLKHLG